MMPTAITFTANHIPGSGRGASLGSPTINLDPQQAPVNLPHGVYAVRVTIGDTQFDAVLHFGERPTFHDSLSCEVYILDVTDLPRVSEVTVNVLDKIRGVESFSSPEELKAQIQKDIATAKRILSA